MMALREHLLVPGDAEEGRTGTFEEVATVSRTQMLGLGIAFTVGVCAGPYVMAGGAVSDSVPDETTMQLMATPESLGGLKPLYKPFKPYAGCIEFIGVLIYCLPFLMFGFFHAKDFSNFSSWLGSMGLPQPKLLAAGGVVSLILGPVLLLTGVPVLVMVGSKILGLFLVFATYFGHYKPLQTAAKDSWPYMLNMLMLLKNITLIGFCCVLGWSAVPTALNLKAYAPTMTYIGLVIVSIGFMVPAMMHLMKFNDFVGYLGSLGVPLPGKLAAVSGIAMLIGGCILLYTGSPMLIEIGAEVLTLFTMGASFYGHFKPWKAAEEGTAAKQEQFMLLLKNIGIIGGLIMVIGKAIPNI